MRKTIPVVLAILLLALAVTGAYYLVRPTGGSSGPGEGVSGYLIGVDDAGEVGVRHWRYLILDPDSFESPPQCGCYDVVLAYLNVGYAEEWRDYYGGLPGSILHGESGYEGEFLVEYWSGLWHGLMTRLALDYLANGYDGVYLDNIDALEHVSNASWASVDPASAMVDLVCDISHAVKARYNAYVFINIGGATDLLYNDKLANCIDGVLREELWTRWTPTGPEPVDVNESNTVLEALQHVRELGKHVIVVDPQSNAEEAERFCRLAWSYGFSPVPQPAWSPDYTVPPPSDWCS
ncbi:MAG: endo alpha-1,4 polygalactosaminidase [Desulfurococcales archaeon]|nr:endo alpha-1,4 polygalactosaminidase [Desulfurococcales archaeon]